MRRRPDPEDRPLRHAVPYSFTMGALTILESAGWGTPSLTVASAKQMLEQFHQMFPSVHRRTHTVTPQPAATLLQRIISTPEGGMVEITWEEAKTIISTLETMVDDANFTPRPSHVAVIRGLLMLGSTAFLGRVLRIVTQP